MEAGKQSRKEEDGCALQFELPLMNAQSSVNAASLCTQQNSSR